MKVITEIGRVLDDREYIYITKEQRYPIKATRAPRKDELEFLSPEFAGGMHPRHYRISGHLIAGTDIDGNISIYEI